MEVITKAFKLGYQAPKGCRIKYGFWLIELEDMHYCASHDFWFDPEEQGRLLHFGQPCFYTDGYLEGKHNSYKRGTMGWWRGKGISLKKALRLLKRTRNIPIGTIIKIEHNWSYTSNKGTRINLGYKYKVKKENTFDPKYEVRRLGYFRNFTTDNKAKELTDLLRVNGFLVKVHQENPNFISSIISTAAAYTGKYIETKEEGGETAVAYGHGLRIGYSSNNESFYGYSNGKESVLFDKWDEFNKWSQCHCISKEKTNEEILQILLTKSKEQ